MLLSDLFSSGNPGEGWVLPELGRMGLVSSGILWGLVWT